MIDTLYCSNIHKPMIKPSILAW